MNSPIRRKRVRVHPTFPTLKEAKKNGKLIRSDHALIECEYPTATGRPIKIFSYNVMGLGAENNLTRIPEDKTSDERYKLIANDLKLCAKARNADIICLQEVTSPVMVKPLAKALGRDWVIVPSLEEVLNAKEPPQLLTCYKKSSPLTPKEIDGTGQILLLSEKDKTPDTISPNTILLKISSDGKSVTAYFQELSASPKIIDKKLDMMLLLTVKQSQFFKEWLQKQNTKEKGPQLIKGNEELIARITGIEHYQYASLDIFNRTLYAEFTTKTGETIPVYNVWSEYDPYPHEKQEYYKRLLAKGGFVIGDTNSRIAPFHNKPTNLTTGIIPRLENKIRKISDDIQLPDHPDGGFYLQNGVIVQLDHQVINPETGKIFTEKQLADISGIDEVSLLEYRPILCLDHRYLKYKIIGEETILNYEVILRKKFSEPILEVGIASTIANSKGIYLRFPRERKQMPESYKYVNDLKILTESLKKFKDLQFKSLTGKGDPSPSTCIFVPDELIKLFCDVVNQICQFRSWEPDADPAKITQMVKVEIEEPKISFSAIERPVVENKDTVESLTNPSNCAATLFYSGDDLKPVQDKKNDEPINNELIEGKTSISSEYSM